MKKKLIALLAAVAMVFSLAACGSTPDSVGTIGTVDITSGLYLLAQYDAYQKAADLAASEQDATDVKAFLKQTITVDADSGETATVSGYVSQKTMENLETYAAIETRFEELGGQLTAEEEAQADSYASQLMEQYGDTYKANGIGLNTVQRFERILIKSSDLLELVRTGSCQSASINFVLPNLRQELKHAEIITVEIGANDVLVPIMYGVAAAMGGPQVFEALLPMLEGDFRQMDASSFAALRENLDSLNITAQQRKALLQLLSSGIAEICTQSQASTLANLEALLQELKALNPNAQIVLVGYYNPLPLLPALANPFVKHFRTLSRSVQKLAQQYDAAFAPATYTVVANDAHPTVCGHKYLARQILKALEK